VEPGVLDFETAQYGLATPIGTVSHTGVFGLVLGGGFGWISRKYGLSVDNVLEADVVLADGSLVNCSLEKNADLFWQFVEQALTLGLSLLSSYVFIQSSLCILVHKCTPFLSSSLPTRGYFRCTRRERSLMS